MKLTSIQNETEESDEDRGGRGKRENKWVWGFLSSWWMDEENRGSQKEKGKNSIAPLPWHLFLRPFIQSRGLLSLSSLPRALLSPMTGGCSHPFVCGCPPLFFRQHPAVLLCVHLLICLHLHRAQTKDKISPSHWVSSSSLSTVEALKFIPCWSQMTHLYSALWLFYEKPIFTPRDSLLSCMSFSFFISKLLCPALYSYCFTDTTHLN